MEDTKLVSGSKAQLVLCDDKTLENIGIGGYIGNVTTLKFSKADLLGVMMSTLRRRSEMETLGARLLLD